MAYTSAVAHDGIPDLEVLLTSDEWEAANYIAGWQGVYHFGLDMEWRPTFKKGEPPSRSALLQVCAGSWVLVFDLTRVRKPVSRPLPDSIWSFLENKDHTFYGMGLVEDIARLAFEFDCVVQGIDFTVRAWPGEFQLGGGLSGLANRVLGTTVKQSKKITKSNWDKRPLTQQQMVYLAEDAYLSWALARHFMKTTPAKEDWLITDSEMYGAGVKFIKCGLAVPVSCHDWRLAKEEWERLEDDRSRKKLAAKKTAPSAKRRSERRIARQEEGTHDPQPAKERSLSSNSSNLMELLHDDSHLDHLRSEHPDLSDDALEDMYLDQLQDDAADEFPDHHSSGS